MASTHPTSLLGTLDHDSSAAVAIGIGALIALCWSGVAQGSYEHVLNVAWPLLRGHVNSLATLHAFVTNGLMTVFFFAIGLELSREIRIGTLSKPSHSMPPVLGALGGMVVTALLSLAIGHLSHTSALVRGWGVPMATDVAFTLGILAVAGRRLPPTLRIFLLTLAVADDAFSAAVLSLTGHATLHVAGLVAVALLILAGAWLSSKMAHPVLSLALLVALWGAFVWANIDPPLAGVLAGLLTSFHNEWARRLERAASRLSIGVVLPLFAVVACGVRWSSLSLHGPTATIIGATIVIRLVGKVLGISAGVALAHAMHFRLPSSITWPLLFSAAMLCAIGFTVPLLFAAALFGPGTATYGAFTLGLVGASLLSAILGVSLLRYQTRAK
jgi:NhaA family Na+:H+ antiporter